MQLSEEQRQEYENQLQDLDQQQFWLEVMVQQQTQSYYLEQILSELRGESEPTPEEPDFECLICGQEVSESRRRTHLDDTHSAPASVNLEGEFKRL